MKAGKIMSITNKVYGIVMIPGYVYLGTAMFVYGGMLDAVGRIWSSDTFTLAGNFAKLTGMVCVESAADAIIEL